MAFEKVSKLLKEMDVAREKFGKDGRKALKEAFKEFFNQVPEAVAIHFSGYTPSWNDGDVCTFGMNGFNLIIRKKDLEALTGKKMTQDEYNESCLPYEGHQYDLSGVTNPRAREIRVLLESFEEKVMDDDLFQQVFGESFQVKATSGKFEVEEYEGDY